MEEGQVLGSVKVLLDGEALTEYDIIASQAVPRMEFGTAFWSAPERPLRGRCRVNKNYLLIINKMIQGSKVYLEKMNKIE